MIINVDNLIKNYDGHTALDGLVSSTMSDLEIQRVIRLNPNNVLPIALGEPVRIGIVFLFITIKRRKGNQ